MSLSDIFLSLPDIGQIILSMLDIDHLVMSSQVTKAMCTLSRGLTHTKPTCSWCAPSCDCDVPYPSRRTRRIPLACSAQMARWWPNIPQSIRYVVESNADANCLVRILPHVRVLHVSLARWNADDAVDIEGEGQPPPHLVAALLGAMSHLWELNIDEYPLGGWIPDVGCAVYRDLTWAWLRPFRDTQVLSVKNVGSSRLDMLRQPQSLILRQVSTLEGLDVSKLAFINLGDSASITSVAPLVGVRRVHLSCLPALIDVSPLQHAARVALTECNAVTCVAALANVEDVLLVRMAGLTTVEAFYKPGVRNQYLSCVSCSVVSVFKTPTHASPASAAAWRGWDW